MILTVPGLYGSGPEHWQSRWERTLKQCSRVEQEDWQNPQRAKWAAKIEEAVAQSHLPPVLVGHSLGCIAIAYWAQQTREGARGALLVAPADTENEDYPPGSHGFKPVPTRKLPFPSIVVASEDDPWLSVERAQEFARNWGSRFVSIGRAGHINSDSGLGDWPQGQALLQSLLKK